jgi:molecular chaperone IbpA
MLLNKKDMNMRTFDFSPLYKSTIGFDHVTAMLENVNKNESQSTYPPYNIELTGTDQYKITMALAGFKEDELRIQSEQQTLSVIGEKEDIPANKNFLHQGIAARNFERRFKLADHVEVTGAELANGLLHIELVRIIPEAMRPKTIQINSKKPSLYAANTAQSTVA